MKRLASVIAATLIFASTPSQAADCNVLMAKLKSWVDAGNFVRVNTTLTEASNRVAYTRGYLEVNEIGILTAPSLRTRNESFDPANPPFSEAEGDHVTIQVQASQVNYLIDNNPGASVGYAAQCRDDDMMLVLPSTGGVLAVSFRFSAP